MKLKISVANLVMLVGGVLTLIFSFLDFYGSNGFGVSAWSTDGGAFVTTIPAILAIAMIVWCGLELGGVKLPEKVITYSGAQMKGTWGIASAGVMLAFLTVDGDKAAGFWLMFIGSLAMAAGAVMGLLNLGGQTVDLSAIKKSDGETQ